MPASVLRSQLAIDCRYKANMESSQFVTDAELNRYIDQACKELYDKLIDARGERYYVTTITTATTAGQSFVQLPADFYQLINVRLNVNGSWVTLEHYENIDLDVMLNAVTSAPTYPIRYRQSTSLPTVSVPGGLASITMLPTPQAVFSVQIDYVPTYTAVTVNGDVSLDGINGWEEFVTWKVAAIMIGKEEGSPAFALQMLAREEKRVEALRDRRDAGRGFKVTDVRRDFLGQQNPMRRFPW